ncbi:aspartate--ammonia ligase [Zongyangia hominis]|uniref:Aspartate--ammonia ligase n=1 Tax=Zongyangia hominis TaxID=2763677 RepID=A0A926EDA0_9FIRM|nr:aspartate--ammonia ligase [Zongyangia hominis]MBC8570289.1 aspartate--ammonia ligase [Zongyangia hominis]
MSVKKLILPEIYLNKLDILETEVAIKLIKDTFERELAKALHLTRVSAPLFVRPESGLNDDLNGVERPVQFDILDLGADVQIVHSLAKWKRLALRRYGFGPGTGLYTDMNAVRRDEDLDNLHSVYVDQWDWEKVIDRDHRTFDYVKETVLDIVGALRKTQSVLSRAYPALDHLIEGDVFFITSQELADLYPQLTPHEREDRIAKEKGIVFISQIGGKLRDGKPHDGRAPDYDDWQLNGDILVWYPVLDRAVEISSMGIRVDPQSLAAQLKAADCEERSQLDFHKRLLAGELPLTMGGGIGQSRICMLLLQKAHIGEVQASIWPEDMIDECEANGIHLL